MRIDTVRPCRFCPNHDGDLELAGYACTIEAHYGRPMDMEWAKDGLDGKLYIVQARPETVASQASATALETYVLEGRGEIISEGRAVGERIASGVAKRIHNPEHLAEFRPGQVLVADTTTPDWEPIMKTAAAIITNRGGRTCHASIIARELGIPAVVGTGDGTTCVPDGETVTVSCADGESGRVYRGELGFHVDRAEVADLARPRTQIMINLGNPALAFKTSFLPNDGVGLARMEFDCVYSAGRDVRPCSAAVREAIISEAHRSGIRYPLVPHCCTEPRRSTRRRHAGRSDRHARLDAFMARTGRLFSCEDRLRKLTEGESAPSPTRFGPKACRGGCRTKTQRVREPGRRSGLSHREPSSVIEARRATRQWFPPTPRVRAGVPRDAAGGNEMGLTNVILMLPFVRRIAEADLVLQTMAELGLRRGENGLKVYAMCEIPNNVILIDEFAKRFDGFSIGSNDLTQLTLGVDRDSEIVAFDYDERDEGVKEMIRLAVEGCRRNGDSLGPYVGQAPCGLPDMAEFLVWARIGSSR